jgi:putative ABC transport system permease protein
MNWRRNDSWRSRPARRGGSRTIGPIWGATKERLREYPLRSVLGALGVAVGAASIVFLTSLVQSAAGEATQGLLRLGQNRIFVASAPPTPGSASRRRILNLQDAQVIRQRVHGISHVTPLATLTATMVACGQRYPVNVKAVGVDHLALENQRLARGRYVTDIDIRGRASVAIVGHSLWRKIPCVSRLQSFVQLGTQSYEIVGLLDRRGQRWGDDLDESVHIPFSTAELRYIGAGAPVSLVITVSEGSSVSESANAIRRVLRRQGSGRDNGEQVLVYSQTDLVKETAALSDKVSALVALLLSVAILIAGIGVVNSVMTSVLERTAEIGLRRAVGATRRNIARQFLHECLIISTGGAVAGVVSGAMLGALASKTLAFPIVINLKMACAALVTSVVLGLACGLWPACRAASLTPTDALRHE